MQDNRIYQLIARKLSGEASEAELNELQKQLGAEPGDQYLYEILQAYWSQHPDLFSEDKEVEEEKIQRILSLTREEPAQHLQAEDHDSVAPSRGLHFGPWVRYAAILLVIAGASFFIITNLKSPSARPQAGQPRVMEVIAKSGSRSSLVLPDGSRVWLNSESRITYLNDFNKDKREVTLEGEAYFDVAHDAQHPFIVHTTGIDIKVLGTAFNVRSYASDKTIETTLLRGSVEIIKKNDPASPRIILRPHEKMIFSKDKDSAIQDTDPKNNGPDPESSISVVSVSKNKPDSSMSETSWVYNKLVFDGESFEEVAARLGRWYNTDIEIKTDQLKKLRLRGSFDRETIEEALEALKLITPFEYRIGTNRIEIYKR
jgi:transmembrane sensor